MQTVVDSSASSDGYGCYAMAKGMPMQPRALPAYPHTCSGQRNPSLYSACTFATPCQCSCVWVPAQRPAAPHGTGVGAAYAHACAFVHSNPLWAPASAASLMPFPRPRDYRLVQYEGYQSGPSYVEEITAALPTPPSSPSTLPSPSPSSTLPQPLSYAHNWLYTNQSTTSPLSSPPSSPTASFLHRPPSAQQRGHSQGSVSPEVSSSSDSSCLSDENRKRAVRQGSKPAVEAVVPPYRSHVGRRRPRRDRLCFSTEQIQCLEASFSHKYYLSLQEREELAEEVRISQTQVKTWYQNRRTKWKRNQKMAV